MRSATASWRCTMSAMRAMGLHSQARRRRLPITVVHMSSADIRLPSVPLSVFSSTCNQHLVSMSATHTSKDDKRGCAMLPWACTARLAGVACPSLSCTCPGLTSDSPLFRHLFLSTCNDSLVNTSAFRISEWSVIAQEVFNALLITI